MQIYIKYNKKNVLNQLNPAIHRMYSTRYTLVNFTQPTKHWNRIYST